MRARDIMMRNPVSCHREATLSETAALMQLHNCGSLPITDEQSRVVGMITDRDICMALAGKTVGAANVRVREILSRELFACRGEDEIHSVLRCMRDHHVRRLPVVSESGTLEGIISIDDMILSARWAESRDVDLTLADVVRTLRCLTYCKQLGSTRAPS